MAVQIFQEPGFGERLGTALGTGLGSGLSQGIESIISDRMKRLSQTQQAQSLIPGLRQAIPGLSDEAYQSLALLPPPVLSQYMKEQSRQASEEEFAKLANKFLGDSSEGLPDFTPPEPGGIPGDKEALRDGSSPIDGPGLIGKQSERLPRISGKHFTDLIKIQQKERQNELQAERASEKYNKEFLSDFRKQYEIDRKIYNEAKSALNILQKYKDSVPAGYLGLLPDKFFSDPHTRELLTRYNAITNLLGQSNKGQPTQFKLQLIQSGKVDKSQPLETQIANLNHLLSDVENSTFYKQKVIETLKDRNKGKYPTNLGTHTIDELAFVDDISNQLPDPGDYSDDTVLEADGIEFEKKYNSWIPKGVRGG